MKYNTYCVGSYSYPGTVIADNREISKGRCYSKSNSDIQPCIYSMNAFGSKKLTAFADPPEFFNDSTTQKKWHLSPATVCIWPYEVMYSDEMRKASGGYDNDARLKASKEYFEQFEEHRSLIFYYANYSNPFSEEDQRKYVLVGISRLKKIGDPLFYDNCSAETRQKFGGGFVWQRNITSHYPEQGLCLPYHRYLDYPEKLEKFLFLPENPRNFKYATRPISDDDALDLVERFLEIASILKGEGDTSEDWSIRISWLQSLIAELWKSRGLYPGLTKVLDYIDFQDAIPYFKSQVAMGKEHETRDAIFDYLDGRTIGIPDFALPKEKEKAVSGQWQLKEDDEKRLLRDILPRFDLHLDQIERILSEDREGYGIYASLDDIADNPYILTEEFIGDGPDDTISFNKIDHGMFPSPELGGKPLANKDDWRRLRGLCVERLKREDRHTFMPAKQVIYDINHKLSFLPAWKRHQFKEKYLDVDKEELSVAITIREEDGQKYLYLKSVFESERDIEKQIRSLSNSPNIRFKSPVTEKHWHDYLYNSDCLLAKENPKDYEDAIRGQIDVCQEIFVKPLCVLSGAAGTGKTTVIKALIRAIEKAHGAGTSFLLMAPTGKAADRIREATKKPASTIHSFLAQRGWLNDNLTFKRKGGRQEEDISTYIIDEASMINLDQMVTLFRAINWASIQRVILIGDHNQLPPIGRGKVFADIIGWLQEQKPENVGILQTNIRQMENRLKDKGTGILELASLYTRTGQMAQKNEAYTSSAELILQRIQEGGDIDKDLRIIYWSDPNDLAQKLIDTIVSDLEEDTGQHLNEERPFELWNAAFKGGGNRQRPEYQQVISPYRGEQFGSEHLNSVLQKHANGRMLERVGHLDTITLFDKVIQFCNRPKSDRIWAYNTRLKSQEQIEVYNGELGFTKPHGFDKNIWQWAADFRIERFQVVFSQKAEYWVGYGSKLGNSPKGRKMPNESVGDNLELAYAISVHKAQGSEFERVYFILPKYKKALLSTEMFYTGMTRAIRHCTILVQEDISPFISMRRPESSHLIGINSSLFFFCPIPEAMQNIKEWYEEGKM